MLVEGQRAGRGAGVHVQGGDGASRSGGEGRRVGGASGSAGRLEAAPGRRQEDLSREDET